MNKEKKVIISAMIIGCLGGLIAGLLTIKIQDTYGKILTENINTIEGYVIEFQRSNNSSGGGTNADGSPTIGATNISINHDYEYYLSDNTRLIEIESGIFRSEIKIEPPYDSISDFENALKPKYYKLKEGHNISKAKPLLIFHHGATYITVYKAHFAKIKYEEGENDE